MKVEKWIKKSSLQMLLILFVGIGIGPLSCSKKDDGEFPDF